jgi:hypothetical protein
MRFFPCGGHRACLSTEDVDKSVDAAAGKGWEWPESATDAALPENWAFLLSF